MPLIRFPTVKGLVYTIDLSKIADRENPRTVEAPIAGEIQEPVLIDWGDGTAPQVVSSGTYPAHTYAEGAGNVFCVTLRSATGHLPRLMYSTSNSNAEGLNPTMNVTLAIISLDHFAGWAGAASLSNTSPLFNGARNMTYCDPRYAGQVRLGNIAALFQYCEVLEQDIQSFCFDFCTMVTTADHVFTACRKLYGTPEGIFDALEQNKSFGAAFSTCESLSPPPFVFWKADGTLDTDKFPNLTVGTYAYSLSNAALRAQVPTDYGGTMTVS